MKMPKIPILLLIASTFVLAGCIPQSWRGTDGSVQIEEFSTFIDVAEAELTPEQLESQQLSPDDSIEQLEREIEGTVIFEEDFSDL
jgi:hypothetical protein